jgi:alanyl aminopeptidase
VQAWRPAWAAGVRLVTRRASVLDADTLQTARRLRQPIQSAHDIENAFDRITYAKGAAVLTMFEHWLGEETFRDGIRAYLRQHAWQHTTAADFLAALSTVAGRDVATPFATFLEQVGAPLLTFALACSPHQPPQLRLTQARYRPQGSQADPQGTWQVPVCVAYLAGDQLSRACTLLSAPTAAMILAEAGTSCPAWVVPNVGGIGYYRAQLDGNLLGQLLEHGMPRLSRPERVSVVDDVHALVRAGTVEVALALGLVERYAHDDSRHMVAAVVGIVDGVRDVVPDELRPNFARFIRTLFGTRARQLGWMPAPDEDDDTRLLRTRLLRLVTDAGDAAALASEGRRLALAWLEHHDAVDPNLVEVALGAATRYGDHTLFERLYTAAQQATDHRDRQRLLSALASFRDPALVQRALAVVLSETFDIREAMGVFFGGLAAPATRRLVYEFVKEQLDVLLTKTPSQAARSLVQVGVAQCDAALKAEMEAVFKDRISTLPGGPRVFAQALERLGLCVQQRDTYRPGVVQFLRQY